MKKVLVAATAAAAAAALAFPVWAEDTRIPAGVFTNVQTQDQYLAKDTLVGAKVHGPDGKIIGDIEDLIINDFNQIVGVVMGTGGFMGMGEKKVGVNLSALKFSEDGGKTTITLPEATVEVIAAAEAYQRAQPKKSLLERAQEKAQELKDKTTATSEDAIEKAKPAMEQAKEKAMEAAEKAKEAYEKAKESAGPALDAAKAAIDDASAKASAAVEDAKAAAGVAVEQAKDAAGAAVESAKEAVAPAAETPPAPADAPAATPAPEAPATP